MAGRTRSSSEREMSEKEKKRRRRGGRGDNVSGGWHVIWREVTSGPWRKSGMLRPGEADGLLTRVHSMDGV